MADPKITFAIPTYSSRGRVLEIVPRVRASAGRLPHEIIVIDKDSTDGGAEAVLRRFPRVRLIELDTPQDASSRNLALVAARAEYVFMLDDATWPDKAAVEMGLEMMAQQPRLAAAGCRIHHHAETPCPLPPGPAGVFPSAAALLRRRAIIEVGGYPLDAADFAEPYDLCARLWQAGWQVRRLDAMRAWRKDDADRPDAQTMWKVLTASMLRFWSRYAPDAGRQALIDETVRSYKGVARQHAALAGYEEGVTMGLAAVRQERIRRPLTEDQLADLFGPGRPPIPVCGLSGATQTAA